jgi:hypothetical protein
MLQQHKDSFLSESTSIYADNQQHMEGGEKK